jgi:hypothetical protein
MFNIVEVKVANLKDKTKYYKNTEYIIENHWESLEEIKKQFIVLVKLLLRLNPSF